MGPIWDSTDYTKRAFPGTWEDPAQALYGQPWAKWTTGLLDGPWADSVPSP